MPSVLSFAIHPVNHDATLPADTPVALSISPLVDGHLLEPKARYCFDAVLMLALGARAEPDVNLFTCSCGVAGCAGIFDETAIEAADSTVAWAFPERPFREDLNPALFEAGQPLRVVFSRAQYETALEQLVASIKAMAQEVGRNVDIWCSSDSEEGVSAQELDEVLAESRERTLAWYDRMAWRQRVWGELLATDLQFTLPNGYVGCIPLENLAELICEAEGLEDYAPRIEADLAPQFRLGLGAVVKAATAVAWPVFAESTFRSDKCPAELDLNDVAADVPWPDVAFELASR